VAIHPLVSDAIVIPNYGPRLDLYIEGPIVTVDIHCGAAVMRGADVFAPGVLSTPKGMQVSLLL
jgi:predicted ribosome-associated RNA-binding protein Tma20